MEAYRLEQYRDRETKMVLREIYYNAAGQKDRGGLPSLIEYNDNCVPYEFNYFRMDELHRINGPAAYEVNPENGIVIQEYWYVDGQQHRSGGLPSIIHRDDVTGVVVYRAFYENGKETRPEIEGIDRNKEFEEENLHNISGP
ncbi:MAG: hypothetical protein AB2551_10950 [Candidatus Thiodiazotropha sp.]